MKNITINNLKGCARCGENHHNLVFKSLTNPIGDGTHPGDATHWCQCPQNGEPILMTSLIINGKTFNLFEAGNGLTPFAEHELYKRLLKKWKRARSRMGIDSDKKLSFDSVDVSRPKIKPS